MFTDVIITTSALQKKAPMDDLRRKLSYKFTHATIASIPLRDERLM